METLHDNALKVLERRYLRRNSAGELVETPEQLFRRVANAVAAADGAYPRAGGSAANSADVFFEMMASLRFLPNSPTLMNAGKPDGQLSACFVLPVEDDLAAIFEAVKNAALIHKSGGGTGFSFSRLRAAGAIVNSTGGVASGPVSFMRVFNAATEAVKQGGTRRGANMGILRVDHPDILSFIRCKQDNGDITNFNISVGLTEEFMQAAGEGRAYDLVDPHTKQPAGSLNAGEVFDTIVDAAWRNGEPGIIFLDRLNNDNPAPSLGEIESTNPCGEQPLLPYESCNLGSINLIKMLNSCDFGCEIDWQLLKETAIDAVHFLDNVIDINVYPLAQIDEKTKLTRKIGLGVMGFADMLLSLGIPYDSPEALALAGQVMSFIQTEGRSASAALAAARGAFPLFGESVYKDGPPLRNATVTTIAPTGTLSIIAGCSSGIEPVFAFVYERNIMDNTRMMEVNPVLEQKLQDIGLYTPGIMQKISENGTLAEIGELPEALRRLFVCAHDISPAAHISMQAAFQAATDNAVSKTVNFPQGATREDVAAVYRLAYEKGCKGVTIYRDKSRENQVLNTAPAVGAPQASTPTGAQTPTPPHTQPAAEHPAARIVPRPRPPITQGFTERMKIGCGNLYVTVNYDENGICEVFTSTGKAGGCPSQSEATARLCSVALRSGMSVEEIASQLKGIRCPSTIRQPGMSCTSCPDAIARIILKVDRYIRQRQTDPSARLEQEKPTVQPANGNGAAAQQAPEATLCPECASALQYEGGCTICRNCGYSRCG